ncbi:type II toxin-antitoxin system VapC family toxin [Pseudonocardia hydrocarbonoxydans]|jgi:PIN domain nuclease of toxin-antitoxin system|uniref:Twitching motility protein PilT n=1 Tax=Pseudonocardia hydrocarbonoxydans TaxID=76726 RepID=A0A4Y3WRJ4_9PSEU|nr:type II toxin-antitoxin system VapC family toxin [Pseudonocardia hydrocarbonoxydans]GEC20700.1 twitching motility protein PilT [Pseudonocardia hydrocarbonoxydans]
MHVLLDTNALLWLLGGDERLGPDARRSVEAAESLAVSVASLWEIAIKVSIGKLGPVPGLYATVRDLGLDRLDITDAHLASVEALPWHHRDPFDRLLICQALTAGLSVLTADDAFAAYGVPVLDARL